MEFLTINNGVFLYDYTEIKDAIKKAGILSKNKNNKGVEYINYPFSFDIETTSFIVQTAGQSIKQGIMYIWTLGIGDNICIQGRTWDSFIYVCDELSQWFKLNDKRRLVIYVHNLSYEFQFMHKHFKWVEVFSLKTREPVRALCEYGIEFRCSYLLSGYSLAKLSEQLIHHDIKKLRGDLDYSKLRNCKTKLTPEENNYCINDVLVVNAYIAEYIERVGYIFEIPMTKTGEVRKFTRNYCFYGGPKRTNDNDTLKNYRKIITRLTLSKDTYTMLKSAFQGGFTHANALYVGETVKNVYSFDFTSSYPYVMLSEKFPMASPKLININDIEDAEKRMKNFCCVFTIEFINIRQKVFHENYISRSHCNSVKNCVTNNGRVVSANYLITTITEQDYYIIKDMYEWDECMISNFYIMQKDYLPTNFILAILDLYEQKTTLKGVEGMELEYLLSKERINAMYGMCVTDICRDKIVYSPDEWTKEQPDFDKAIEHNNKSKRRFLYYAWGVWVTAYARRNLFTAINELQDDYVYSDTDSVKFINYENHKEYFNNYNDEVINKLNIAMRCHGIDPARTRPKNKKGQEKQIGIWDSEGMYRRFKTLGAKRYIVEKDNAWLYLKSEWVGDIPNCVKIINIDNQEFLSLDVNITVSGLNKMIAVPYLMSKYKDKIFEAFFEQLYVPPDFTGKMTHTYIDEPYKGIIKDYQGNIAEYSELSGIHLSNADYTLSINEEFARYVLGIKEMIL